MICYQPYMSGEVVPMDAEAFARLSVSDDVMNRISMVRKLRGEGKTKGADLVKRSLPLICFTASSFDTAPAPSDSKDGRRKKGQTGHWRLQHTVRLNGLYMADYDHVGDPKQLFQQWIDSYVAENEEAQSLDRAGQRAAFCGSLGVLLVHVTSSGEGLRLVAVADAARGNLADNQAWLAKQLGMQNDDACKDASRGSYAPSFEDILYINKEKLFTYENEEYDKAYGDMYRSGNSAPIRSSNNGSIGAAAQCVLQREYGGVTYEKIIDCWLAQEVPGYVAGDDRNEQAFAGARHRLLLKLGADLRYICDQKEVLKALLEECALGASLRREGSQQEVDRLADDCYAYRLYKDIPKRLGTVLKNAGVCQHKGDDGRAAVQASIDYDAWWQRLEPLLDESPYLREACALLPPHHRMAGVLAGGAMFGTYLSRCWWDHFDGRRCRLSFLVYIIGSAASGKSKIGDLNALIMAPMRAADELGRQMERDYERSLKKRQASSRDAKEAAPEAPQPVVRIVPSSISNKILYERLTFAQDKEHLDYDGTPMRLHLYSYEPELSTALRVEGQGGWASKLDLECKAFHNEEAGVDYANSRDVNGIIQVNWNRIITGTADAMRRKIKKGTVLDGLVTRLCLFQMPDAKYQMIARGCVQEDSAVTAKLNSVGMELEKLSGRLECERLVDYAFDYENELCQQAANNDDRCLDYFRKRIPLIMIRYTLVRAVLRQLPQLLEGKALQISDSDLQFARLVGDFCLDMQIYMYGNEVMEALDTQNNAFVPRKRRERTKALLNKLPTQFTKDQFISISGYDDNAAAVMLHRLSKDGVVMRNGEIYTINKNAIDQ